MSEISFDIQMLYYWVDSGNPNYLSENKIDSSCFMPAYRPVVQYINEFVSDFEDLPSWRHVIEKFELDDFDEVDPENYVIAKVREQKAKFLTFDVLVKANELYESDNLGDMVLYLQAETQRLVDELKSKDSEGYDWVKKALDRIAQYEIRKENPDATFLSFGLPSLDEALAGIAKDEMILIVGRLNQGKSWVALLFLLNLWKAGLNVILWSLEMQEEEVSSRLDTMYTHLSNRALITGRLKDEADSEGMSKSEYETYIEYMQMLYTKGNYFKILTNKDNGGKPWTVSSIRAAITRFKPDVYAIDQLSKLEDERNGFSIREKYVNLSNDLRQMILDTNTPCFLLAQANRQAAKQKKFDAKFVAPEVDDVMESDAIAQNATIQLSLAKNVDMFSVIVKKSRRGGVDTKTNLEWDLDKGIFQEIEECTESF